MKKNIVFISDIDNPLTSKYSIDSWGEWCKKNESELMILGEKVCNNPEFNKFFVFDLLENQNIEYNQILLTNNSTIINPKTPNIFNITDGKLCGVFQDSSYELLFKNMEFYSKYMFNNFTFPYWNYINTGVLIINKTHKSFFDKIKNLYINNLENINNINQQFKLETDSPLFNFLMHIDNIDFKIIQYKWNMHDIIRKEIVEDLMFTDIGWIYQFDFLPEYKNYLMESTYKKINT